MLRNCLLKQRVNSFGRALIRSMSEILFLCGANRNAVIATLTVSGNSIEGSEYSAGNEVY